MSGIGPRLREEREHLSLTQKEFGALGGVAANAQGKYESGERTPKADYLAAVARHGVDVRYVLTGERTPIAGAGLSPEEEKVLCDYRTLPTSGQVALGQMACTLAEISGTYSATPPVRARPVPRKT